MRLHQFVLLLLTCGIAFTACRKSIDTFASPNQIARVYDTTTVEKIVGRWGTPANAAYFTYYFYYDSIYRIKQSVMVNDATGFHIPDTGFYRKYRYRGNDSLPYQIIYGNNERSSAGSFLRDTGYLFYDAANRLVKDSGNKYENWGYGIVLYYTRIISIHYFTNDSFSVSTTIIPLDSSTTATSWMQYFKNNNTSSQQIQKNYRDDGTLATVYAATLDTMKNPLAKAFLDVYPYYDHRGHAIGDGAFGWHFPLPNNRTSLSIQHWPNPPGSPPGYGRNENYIITCNAQQLPIEMVRKDLITPTFSDLILRFYY
jgi:hypothetical protein